MVRDQRSLVITKDAKRLSNDFVRNRSAQKSTLKAAFTGFARSGGEPLTPFADAGSGKFFTYIYREFCR